MSVVIFNGRTYHQRKKGYWKSGKLWLHREVWKASHGEIPPGFYIHHKDHNRSNNNIENLELVNPTDHMAIHKTPELVEIWKKNLAKACEAARTCKYRRNHEACSRASKLGWARHKEKIAKVESLGIRPVYNMVTDSHHFVANGMVVHNCDALRYIVKTKVNPRRLTQ